MVRVHGNLLNKLRAFLKKILCGLKLYVVRVDLSKLVKGGGEEGKNLLKRDIDLAL